MGGGFSCPGELQTWETYYKFRISWRSSLWDQKSSPRASDTEKLINNCFSANIKLQTACFSSLGELQTPGEVNILSSLRRIRMLKHQKHIVNHQNKCSTRKDMFNHQKTIFNHHNTMFDQPKIIFNHPKTIHLLYTTIGGLGGVKKGIEGGLRIF